MANTRRRVPEGAAPDEEGYAVVVVLDGAARVLWWVNAPDGVDRVAVAEGRVLSWPDVDACRAYATAHGWLATGEDPEPLNFTPAQAWLSGRRPTLDTQSALNLWNLATDVTASLGANPWGAARLADACHTKLTAAAVPWTFDMDSYIPRWSARELQELKRLLGTAVHVLRNGFS